MPAHMLNSKLRSSHTQRQYSFDKAISVLSNSDKVWSAAAVEQPAAEAVPALWPMPWTLAAKFMVSFTVSSG